MAYGTVKVDTIIFDQGGADQNVTVSGIYRAITSGVTVSGTISGAVLIGTTTVSGATVTGTQSSFTSGNFVTLSGVTATFTSGVIASGTAAAPSLSIVSDPNTGLYSPGADQVALATAGTGRLFVDSSGRVGIGTSSISSTVQVVVDSTVAENGSIFTLATGGGNLVNKLNMGVSSASNYAWIQSVKPGTNVYPLSLNPSGGNVGIGTSSPAALMHVYGSGGELLRIESNYGSDGYILFKNTSGSMSAGMGGAADNIYQIADQTNLHVAYQYRGGVSGYHLFAVNAAERARIDSSGRVGIGTSSPNAALDVVGNIELGSKGASNTTAYLDITTDTTYTDYGFRIIRGGAANGNTQLISRGTGALELNCVDGGYLGFSTSNAERVRIDSSGRVGIGISSPNTLLHVLGGDLKVQRDSISFESVSEITLSNVYRTGRILSSYTNPASITETYIAFHTNRTGEANDTVGEAMRIAGGNVGIGTSFPVTTLQVGPGNTSPNTARALFNTNDVAGRAGVAISNWTGSATTNGPRILFDNSTRGAFEVGGADGTHAFVFVDQQAPAERMRIDSSGRVGIGTSAPTAKLHVETIPAAANQSGSVLFGPDTSYGFEIRNVIDGSGFPRVELRAPTAGNGPILFFAGGSTERMRIDSNGDVAIGTATSLARLTLEKAFAGGTAIDTNTTTASTTYSAAAFRHNGTVSGSIAVSTTATSYLTSSDYRLKENVTAVTDGITRLQQLKPSRFNFIADPDHTVDGFIAHEVQDIVPEAITGEKDAEDDDGNFVYQGIDQSKLVPLLTAALQEAIGKIETLEARLTAAGID